MQPASDSRINRAAAPVIRRGLCALIIKEVARREARTLRERLMIEQVNKRRAQNPTAPIYPAEQAIADADHALVEQLGIAELQAALTRCGVTQQDMRLLEQEFAADRRVAHLTLPHHRRPRPRWEQAARDALTRDGHGWFTGCSSDELDAVTALFASCLADPERPVDAHVADMTAEQRALCAPLLACRLPPARLEWWQARGADGRPLSRAEMTAAQQAQVHERQRRLIVGDTEIVVQEEAPRPLPVEPRRRRRPTTVHKFRGHRGRRTGTIGFLPTKHRQYGRIGLTPGPRPPARV